MKEIVDAVAQVGFPIVISLLLLVRVESKMDKVGSKIEELNENIVKLITVINERIK